MKKIIKNIILVPALVLGLSACTDWLDVKPTTSIVGEDMWKDQSDVEAVVASCYNAMLQNSFMQRVMTWGELRSDNVIHNDAPSVRAAQDQKEMYKSISLSSIVETNGVSSWASIYNVIKLCNFVIHFAPGVCDVDPDYLTSEMEAHLAEAYAIRSLCYFYMLRTFTEFPYVTEPVLDDQENLEVEPVSGESVIPYLIKDLKFALEKAQSKYAKVSDTKYRINRNAAAAILADLYLWKASGEEYPQDSISYDEAIKYCDRIFQDTITNVGAGGVVASNQYLSLSTYTSSNNESFSPIFQNTASSTEVIFALAADQESMWEQNQDNLIFVNQVYGLDATTMGMRGDWLTTYKIVPNDKYPNPVNNFVSRDAPFCIPENASGTDMPDARYRYGNRFGMSVTVTTGGYPIWKYKLTSGFSDYPNWIFYRLAEVYLMKAEAMVERMNANFYIGEDGNVKFRNYPTIEDDDSEEVVEAKRAIQANYEAEMGKVHGLVTRIFRRSNRGNRLSPAFENYKLDESSLVFAERRREFLFEGKRWYDLMRIARRDTKRFPNNGNKALIDCVKTKLDEGADLIASRLSTMDALYWPINKSELDRNPKLTQNPYYQSQTSDYEK